MDDKEKLHFKIGLTGEFSTKSPKFNIKLNDVTHYSGRLTVQPNEIEYIEFDAEVADGDNSLEISLLNKLPTDTIKDDNGNIIGDLILSIESIDIDDIELSTLKWDRSLYYPLYPSSYTGEHVKEVKNCVNLGWNGTWKLAFQSPFYIWLLENL
jgi:hypothetical protein